MRLLTAVSGVRVPQQAPEKHPNSRVFFLSKMRGSNLCAAIFAAPSAQPRRHCLPAVDAIAPSANDTLFRRAPRSLRGFVSDGRRQKNTRIHGCFFVPEKGARTSARQFLPRPRRSRDDTACPQWTRSRLRRTIRYSVALRAPYGGSSPRAGARKTPEFTGVFLCPKKGLAPLRGILRPDGRLFGVYLNTHLIFSKTE